VTGVIDFSSAEVNNSNWWLKWRYLLKGIEAQISENLLSHLFSFYLSQVSNPIIANLKESQERALGVYDRLIKNSKPWSEALKQQQIQNEAESFKQQWEKLTGWNPADKEAVARWSEELKTTIRSKRDAREQQGKEAQDRLNSYHRKVEELRQKRLKQQGR
jgi:hypothetical protein